MHINSKHFLILLSRFFSLSYLILSKTTTIASSFQVWEDARTQRKCDWTTGKHWWPAASFCIPESDVGVGGCTCQGFTNIYLNTVVDRTENMWPIQSKQQASFPSDTDILSEMFWLLLLLLLTMNFGMQILFSRSNQFAFIHVEKEVGGTVVVWVSKQPLAPNWKERSVHIKLGNTDVLERPQAFISYLCAMYLQCSWFDSPGEPTFSYPLFVFFFSCSKRKKCHYVKRKITQFDFLFVNLKIHFQGFFFEDT